MELAETSLAMRHRHGAVVYKSGHVLATGINFYRNEPSDYIDRIDVSIHAEMAAIRRVSSDNLKGATVYVARNGRCGKHGMSRPCARCYDALVEAGVKRIVYTD